ncbi:DUF2946 domain-containing protein [Pseudomonas putida]|uniref:DUF2946 domain-containing protein n=1 Tax=Pseudomonas putida TaxID=303 RepID=UPI0030822A6B
MNSHRLRPLIAWTLYACVLFNLLSCGIVHSRMSAMSMDGAGGHSCALAHDAHLAPVKDLMGSHDTQKAGKVTCPLCSGALIVLMTLFALIWPRHSTSPIRSTEPRSKAPPRYAWPSANPRASPRTLNAWSRYAGGNIGVLRAQFGWSTPSVSTVLGPKTSPVMVDEHAEHHHHSMDMNMSMPARRPLRSQLSQST